MSQTNHPQDSTEYNPIQGLPDQQQNDSKKAKRSSWNPFHHEEKPKKEVPPKLQEAIDQMEKESKRKREEVVEQKRLNREQAEREGKGKKKGWTDSGATAPAIVGNGLNAVMEIVTKGLN